MVHRDRVHREFTVVVSAAFVLVVDSSRVRCLFVCCWLGCLHRGDGVTCRVGCLSLLEFHLEPSCAVVSQVMSLVKSLLSLFVLVGWKMR